MKTRSSQQKIAILGATGMVGRRMARMLIDHPDFDSAMLVGSDESIGKRYHAVWEEKERLLEAHYGEHMWRRQAFPEALRDMWVAGFDELLASDIGIVFSSVPERAGFLEDRLISSGRVVFSNSPHRRFDEDVPLVVTEVNGHAIEDRRLIKNPNCVTSGLALVLAPLQDTYGLQEVVVTTYQALSGRGDAKYPADLVCGNIYPLFGSEERVEEYIAREVKKIFGATFRISVTCNRTYVQEGHYVEVRVKTKGPVEGSERAAQVLAGFNPLRGAGLHVNPLEPIVILHERGRPSPVKDSDHHGGMAIAVGNVSSDDAVFDLRLTYVVNNLVRGAAGGALLNAELWLNRRTAPQLSVAIGKNGVE